MILFLLALLQHRYDGVLVAAEKAFVKWQKHAIGSWRYGINECTPGDLKDSILHVPENAFVELFVHKTNGIGQFPSCTIDAKKVSSEIVTAFDSMLFPSCQMLLTESSLWSSSSKKTHTQINGCAPTAMKFRVPSTANMVQCGEAAFEVSKSSGPFPHTKGDWRICNTPGLEAVEASELGPSCNWMSPVAGSNRYHIACAPDDFAQVQLAIKPRDFNARIEVNDRRVRVGIQGAKVGLTSIPLFPWSNATTQLDVQPQWDSWVSDPRKTSALIQVDIGCGCPGDNEEHPIMERRSLRKLSLTNPSAFQVVIEKLPEQVGSLDSLHADGCRLTPEFHPLTYYYVVDCNGKTSFHLVTKTKQDLFVNGRTVAPKSMTRFKIDVYRGVPTTTTFEVVSLATLKNGCKDTNECRREFGLSSVCVERKSCRKVYNKYSIAVIGGGPFDRRLGILLRDPANGDLVTNYAQVVPALGGTVMPRHGPPHMSFDCSRCNQCSNKPIKTLNDTSLADCLDACRKHKSCKFIAHSYPVCQLAQSCNERRAVGAWTQYHKVIPLEPVNGKKVFRPPGSVDYFGQAGTQDCVLMEHIEDQVLIPMENVHLSIAVVCSLDVKTAQLFFTGRGIDASDFNCSHAAVDPINMENRDAPAGTTTVSIKYDLKAGDLKTAFMPFRCHAKRQTFYLHLKAATYHDFLHQKLKDGLSPHCRNANLMNLRHDYPVVSSSPKPQDCIMQPSNFMPGVKEYKLTCPSEVQSVLMYSVLSDPSARMLVNDEPLDSDLMQWHVDEQDNPIGAEFSFPTRIKFAGGGPAEALVSSLTVVCENKQKEYTISMQRGKGMSPQIVGLVISTAGCLLHPAWSAAHYKYDIHCPGNTKWIAIQPRVPDQNAFMVVNGEKVGPGDELDPVELEYGGSYKFEISLSSPMAASGKPMTGYSEKDTSNTYIVTAYRDSPAGLGADSTKIMASVFSTVGILLAIMSGANFIAVARFLQFLGLMVAIKGTPDGFATFAKSFSKLNLQFGHIDEWFPCMKKWVPFDVERFKSQAAIAAGLPAKAVQSILSQEKSIESNPEFGEAKEAEEQAAKELHELKAVQKKYKKEYQKFKENFAKAQKSFQEEKGLLFNLLFLPLVLLVLLIFYGIRRILKTFHLCGYRRGYEQVNVNEMRPNFLLLFILDLGLIGFIRAATEIYFKGTTICIFIPLGDSLVELSPSKRALENFVLVLFFLYPVGFLAFSFYHLQAMRQKILYNKELGQYVDKECVEIKAVEDVPIPVPCIGALLKKFSITLHRHISQVSPIKWIVNSQGKFIFSDASEREAIASLGVAVEKRRDNEGAVAGIYLQEYDNRETGKKVLPIENGDELIKVDGDREFKHKSITYIRNAILRAETIQVKRNGEMRPPIDIPNHNVAESVCAPVRRFSMQLYKKFQEEEGEDDETAPADRKEYSLRIAGKDVEMGKHCDVRVFVKDTCEFTSKVIANAVHRDVQVLSGISGKSDPKKCDKCMYWNGSLGNEQEGDPRLKDANQNYTIKLEEAGYPKMDVAIKYKEALSDAEKQILHRVYLEKPLIEPSCFGIRQTVTEERVKDFDEKDSNESLNPYGIKKGWYMRRIAMRDIPEKVPVPDENDKSKTVEKSLDHISSLVLSGHATDACAKSQLLLLLRDDENAVRGSIRLLANATDTPIKAAWRAEVDRWAKPKGKDNSIVQQVQTAVRRWMVDQASESLKPNLAPEGLQLTANSDFVPRITEVDLTIDTWKLARSGVLEFAFSLVLPKSPRERVGEEGETKYSERSKKFYAWALKFFSSDDANRTLQTELGLQGFEFLGSYKDEESGGKKVSLEQVDLFLTSEGLPALVINDIKVQETVLPHLPKTRGAVLIELEYEGSNCLKKAAPGDRFELWLHGPALPNGSTLLELKKAIFTANVGSHSSQKFVRVCLDSMVFRGQENLQLRASVHEPLELLRVSDSAQYAQLPDEADNDKVKLVRGMSPSGVPYRLSPIYENYPNGLVGQKTLPVSVLGNTKNGKFGFRLVSDIKVQDIPRLHWYCPNAQLDVPTDQLHFPKRDTWSHYYTSMKKNQRMQWFVSRAILLLSICLVAFAGSFKEHVNKSVNQAKHLALKTAENMETSVEKEIPDVVHSEAQQALVKDAQGFNQAVALLVGTLACWAIVVFDECGAKLQDKEDERKEEQEDIKDWCTKVPAILNWYCSRKHFFWWLPCLFQGECFIYTMELILLVVLMCGQNGPMHCMWKDLSSYLLIFLAGATIFIMNIRFLKKKWGKFLEKCEDTVDRIKTKWTDFQEWVVQKWNWIMDLPNYIKETTESAAMWISDKIEYLNTCRAESAALAERVNDNAQVTMALLDDAEDIEDPEKIDTKLGMKSGHAAHGELMELLDTRDTSVKGKVKTLFCGAPATMDDIPVEAVIERRKSFQDRVEEHNKLLSSWHRGEKKFESTPEAVLQQALMVKGEHKVFAMKPRITRITIGDKVEHEKEMFVSRPNILFETVDVIVDSIGMRLNAEILPDKHAFHPRKRLLRITSPLSTTRDLVTRMPIQINYEDFVSQSTVSHTIVGTIHVVNCARLGKVDKPENDSYFTLHTANDLSTAEANSKQLAIWFTQILAWAEKQGAVCVPASRLNGVLDALFVGTKNAPDGAQKEPKTYLLQQYLQRKIAVVNDVAAVRKFLITGEGADESLNNDKWPGFAVYFEKKSPAEAGEIVESLRNRKTRPELLHVVLRAEDLRPDATGEDHYSWNPPMLQAIQAEKFIVTPQKVGVGQPGLLRLLGDRFLFIPPVNLDYNCAPIPEEIKFEDVQSVLANPTTKVHKEKTIPGETLYVLTNEGPVMAFVMNADNIVMWDELVWRYGLDKPKQGIFGHQGPTVPHPTEAGVRLRHGTSGSQTWYMDRPGGRSIVKQSAPVMVEPPTAKNLKRKNSIAVIVEEQEEIEYEKMERIEKGRYDGGWSMHRYHDAGRMYVFDYAASFKGPYVSIADFDWDKERVAFQREHCVYDGLWKDGQRNGKGTFLFPMQNRWYFFDGVISENKPLFGLVAPLDVKNENAAVTLQTFCGWIKKLEHHPTAEFYWLSPLEVFTALAYTVTHKPTELLKMTVGEIKHKVQKAYEMSGSERKYAEIASELTKSLRNHDNDLPPIQPFDAYCIDAMLDNAIQVLPCVNFLEPSRTGSQKLQNMVLSQRVPSGIEKMDDVNDTNVDFLRNCVHLWFQYEATCMDAPCFSVGEENKMEDTMQMLEQLPANTPIRGLKHAISLAKQAGNTDDAIKIILRKSYSPPESGPYPWQERVVHGVYAEDWDMDKAFFRDIQQKYSAITKVMGDSTARFQKQLEGAMPIERSASMIYKEEHEHSLVQIKGQTVQDALDDESKLNLYTAATDHWLTGDALVSLQPSSLEGYIAFNKDFKPAFKGTVKNAALCGSTSMEWNGRQMESTIADGKVTGSCKITLDNAVYEGMCGDGKREGEGKFVSGSYSYEGNWKDDKRDGNGRVATKSFELKGTFAGDVPTVVEEFKVKDKGSNNFEVKNQPETDNALLLFQLEGSDTQIELPQQIDMNTTVIPLSVEKIELEGPGGSTLYAGPLVNHQFHGQGELNTNSCTYSGSFHEGRRHGRGKLEIKNATHEKGQLKGTVWDGEWKNDRPHGQGNLTVVINGEKSGPYEITMNNGIASKCAEELKKPPACPPPVLCCKPGPPEERYPKDLWKNVKDSPHLPGGHPSEKTKGLPISIGEKIKAPAFDVAKAANVPDGLLDLLMGELTKQPSTAALKTAKSTPATSKPTTVMPPKSDAVILKAAASKSKSEAVISKPATSRASKSEAVIFKPDVQGEKSEEESSAGGDVEMR